MDKKKYDTHLTSMTRGKLLITFIVIICLFLLLAGRMVIWDMIHGKTYSTSVLKSQTNSSKEIGYERGKIYDRNGNLLAGNEKIYSLVLEPKNIYIGSDEQQDAYLKYTVQAIVQYLGLDEDLILQSIEAHKDSYYVPICDEEGNKIYFSYNQVETFEKFEELAKKKIKEGKTQEEKDKIKMAQNVKGVQFESSYKRIYPYNSLACHLLGYTSAGNEGKWGIEQYYDSTLNGTNGRMYTYFDEDREKKEVVKEAEDGNSVISTIDLQIQQAIEKKLKEFDDTIGSKETSILVMDPNNGEILGMASSDPYDLNHATDDSVLSVKYSDAQIARMQQRTEEVAADSANGIAETYDEDDLTIIEGKSKVWRNPIIADTHEPGSTFKPFTVCAGLESGVLNGDENYACTGSLLVGGRNIGCSHVHGDITLKQAIAESCNVAMMNIAFKEKAPTFYEYQKLFGFGLKTGIDLPGEANTSTLVYTNETYQGDVSLATNSFGQTFNCTMIQLASGFASLINGGYYYKPHVVKEIQNSNGDIVETKDKELLRQTVSEETSKTIRSYLKETVKSGTGTKAQIQGYSIGGKTGTAEKHGEDVEYKEDYYVSFIGFTPIKNPQVLIYVTIDEPNVEDQANAALAVGLERECMKEIIGILGIEPTGKTSSKTKKESSTSYMKPYLATESTKSTKKSTTKAENSDATTEQAATTAAADQTATTAATDQTATATTAATDQTAATTSTTADQAATTGSEAADQAAATSSGQ